MNIHDNIPDFHIIFQLNTYTLDIILSVLENCYFFFRTQICNFHSAAIC